MSFVSRVWRWWIGNHKSRKISLSDHYLTWSKILRVFRYVGKQAIIIFTAYINLEQFWTATQNTFSSKHETSLENIWNNSSSFLLNWEWQQQSIQGRRHLRACQTCVHDLSCLVMCWWINWHKFEMSMFKTF